MPYVDLQDHDAVAKIPSATVTDICMTVFTNSPQCNTVYKHIAQTISFLYMGFPHNFSIIFGTLSQCG